MSFSLTRTGSRYFKVWGRAKLKSAPEAKPLIYSLGMPSSTSLVVPRFSILNQDCLVTFPMGFDWFYRTLRTVPKNVRGPGEREREKTISPHYRQLLMEGTSNPPRAQVRFYAVMPLPASLPSVQRSVSVQRGRGAAGPLSVHSGQTMNQPFPLFAPPPICPAQCAELISGERGAIGPTYSAQGWFQPFLMYPTNAQATAPNAD